MVSRHATKREEEITMILLATMLAAAPLSPVYRQIPEPGLHRYVYQATETVVGGPVHGYRTEFDIEYAGGAIYAIIRKASVLDGSLKPVELDAACRAALHGDETRLARVKLSPLSLEAAKTLGDSFLPNCAPAGIFFPLTDILNVVLIPSTHFNATGLKIVGQSLPFPGFEAAFDRAGIAIKETASGGEVSLASVDPDRAVIDWKPAAADLEILEEANKPPVRLRGTEHFAFRVEVDRRTGAIARAVASYDNLDMKVVGAPDSMPDLKITRAVSIEPRSDQ
jgi:hypothetical protein